MSFSVEASLQALKIELPEAAIPVANYVGYVRSGNLVYVSGQLPVLNGEVQVKGQVGQDVTVEQAQEAARICVLNLLAQAKNACDGDLNKISRVIRLGGFVNSGSNFTEHAQVVNGASDLISNVFGEKGKHARAAVGCSSLPLGASVEVEALFELVS